LIIRIWTNDNDRCNVRNEPHLHLVSIRIVLEVGQQLELVLELVLGGDLLVDVTVLSLLWRQG